MFPNLEYLIIEHTSFPSYTHRHTCTWIICELMLWVYVNLCSLKTSLTKIKYSIYWHLLFIDVKIEVRPLFLLFYGRREFSLLLFFHSFKCLLSSILIPSYVISTIILLTGLYNLHFGNKEIEIELTHCLRFQANKW